MTGYLTIGADCYDVADRKAVSAEICRMGDIELLIDLIQQCVLIFVGKKRCHIDHLIVIDIRCIPAFLQGGIGYKVHRSGLFFILQLQDRIGIVDSRQESFHLHFLVLSVDLIPFKNLHRRSSPFHQKAGRGSWRPQPAVSVFLRCREAGY